MALDGITVRCLVSELRSKLMGARISKIIQPEHDALFLTCKGTEGQVRMLMSAGASLPLLYTTQKNRQAPLTAPNFCMLLRKHIGSGRIVDIRQPGLERIIHFVIEHYDEMGDLRRKELVLELMGKHSNIIFLDEEGMIIDSIKHISAQTSSLREVLPGRPYFVPVTAEKKDPLTADEDQFAAIVFTKAMSIAKAVYTSYTGISPVIAEELCYRAGIDSGKSAAAAEETERTHLSRQFCLMMEDVKEEKFVPQIIFNEKDEPVEFSAIPLTEYQDMQIQTRETISQVLEEYYARRDIVTRIRQKSADLRHIVTVAVDRTAKKLDLQQKQMKDTEKKETWRLYGELLHTYGYTAQPGADYLTCLNYYTDQEIRIPLDPTLSAADNASRYFDRYAKLKRTAEALSSQIEKTKADLDQLMSIRTFLDLALEEEDLVQVREELMDAGYIRRRFSGKKVKITSRPYHYRTEDGYDLYAGKNNIQNDELTFRFASGSDWWFHAKGAPGSHVIAKVRGTEELPDHVFEDAARLAAYYSANRQSDKVEIDYIQRKHVKKPNGARPGFVVYYTNYSMTIDTDISGLELVK